MRSILSISAAALLAATCLSGGAYAASAKSKMVVAQDSGYSAMDKASSKKKVSKKLRKSTTGNAMENNAPGAAISTGKGESIRGGSAGGGDGGNSGAGGSGGGSGAGAR
jgi:hypothetical protein